MADNTQNDQNWKDKISLQLSQLKQSQTIAGIIVLFTLIYFISATVLNITRIAKKR